jgi:dCTP deaminase
MSIKPDRWIRRKSMPPTHSIAARSGSSDIASLAWEGNTHTVDQLQDLENRFWAGRLKPEHPLVRDFKPMIEPFEAGQVRRMAPDKFNSMLDEMCDAEATMHQLQNPNADKLISYGTSSYGYDVRCADEFKIFTNINSSVIDPKNFDDKCFVDFKGPVCIIPPNSFVLARTVEYFRIPRNVLTICLGKSTYARCGIIVNVTPLEPEWEGHVTLEFSNTTNLPAKIYANEGVAQMLFFESDEECETSYKDRDGKYQGQTGVVVPRI